MSDQMFIMLIISEMAKLFEIFLHTELAHQNI